MFLNLEVFYKKIVTVLKLALICYVFVLCSCSQSEVENNDSDNFKEYEGLSIATPDVVPVFSNTRTSTFLVLHNYTNRPITNIHFHIADNSSSDNRTMLLTSSDGCSILLPHSSCRVNYASPLLSDAKFNTSSDLLVVDYNFANETRVTSAVISYKLVYNDDNADSTIVTMGSPSHMNGTNGTRSAMLYLYVKGKDSVVLGNESFDINSFYVADKNFEDTAVPAGTVLTYEASATYNQTHDLKSYLATTSIARFTLNYIDNNGVKQMAVTSVASNPSYLTGPYIVMQPIPTLHSSVNSNSESFMVYNVGPQSTTVSLTSSGATSNNLSLSPSTFSLPANGGAQSVTLTVNNIGSSATSASITAAASSGNTVTQPLQIVGGANLVVFSPPYNLDLENHAPSINQIISVTNSFNSLGNIKIQGAPNVVASGVNASYITPIVGTSVSNPCVDGLILAPGFSCNYSLSIGLLAPDNSVFNTPYYLTSTVSYANSQDNYANTQTTKSIISGQTYYKGANIQVINTINNPVRIEGNNYENRLYQITFINDTSDIGNLTAESGVVSNIALESNAPPYISLSASGQIKPCNIGNSSTNSLGPMESCTFILQVGPTNSKTQINGATAIKYNYVDNIYQGTSSGIIPFSYVVTPESLGFVIQSATPSGQMSGGNGSLSTPWIFSGGQNGATQNITVWYKNTGSQAVIVESFPLGYGINGYLGTNTFWLPQDNCTNKTLARNESCSVVYQQNYYNTASLQGCNGTNQTMNIVSPTINIKGSLSGNQYTLSNLTYPTNNSATLYASESNIYINNYFIGNNTGQMAPNVQNTYISTIYSTISNVASGYGTFTLNFNNIMVTSNWGGYVAPPAQVMTGVTGNCSYTSSTGLPAFDNPWTQTCNYISGSGGNIGESGYKFMAIPGSLFLFPDFTVTNKSGINQVFCINTPNNQITLQ